MEELWRCQIGLYTLQVLSEEVGEHSGHWFKVLWTMGLSSQCAAAVAPGKGRDFLFERGSFVFYFGDMVSLCSSGWLETCKVDQATLELSEIHLPLTPECWDFRYAPQHLSFKRDLFLKV